MHQAARQRLSAIAHGQSLMWGPIAEATLDELVDEVASRGGDHERVIDLGCGPAELLRRVVERSGARGVGLDLSPHAIAEAGRRVGRSPARDRIELRLADVLELAPEPSHDTVCCIGPGWPSGGWPSLPRWASRFGRPGSLLVLGEGAWRSTPSADVLGRLDMAIDDYVRSDEVDACLRGAGIEPLWTHRATDAEWDAYADAYRRCLTAFASAHPDDPLAPAAAERAGRGWARFELLHATIDFVTVVARAAVNTA